MTSIQKNNLLIIGAGGHGRVVADAAASSERWNEIAFLDDRYPDLNLTCPWKIVGKIEDAPKMRAKFSDAAVGIGNNDTRLRLLNSLHSSGFNLPVIAHPTAAISRHAIISEGSVIFAQAVVNIGAVLGSGCIVNTGSIIDHDCMLGCAVHISPGVSLAGGVAIGDHSWIGIGASVKQQLLIGKNVIIGAGAVVVKNLPDGVTAIGVPACIVQID